MEESKSKVVEEISAEIEKLTGVKDKTLHIGRAYEEGAKATHERYGGPNNEAEEHYIAGLKQRHDEIEKRKFEHLEAEEPEEIPDDYEEFIPVLEPLPMTEDDYVDQLVEEAAAGNKRTLYERDGITFKK